MSTMACVGMCQSRKRQAVDVVWIALLICSIGLVALVVLRDLSNGIPKADAMWSVSDSGRRFISCISAAAVGFQTIGLVTALSYASNEKIPVFLFCACYFGLATATFVLDAMGRLYNPFGWELGVHLLIFASAPTAFSMAAWYAGKDARNGASVRDMLAYAPCLEFHVFFWQCLWPVPRYWCQVSKDPDAFKAAGLLSFVLITTWTASQAAAWVKVKAWYDPPVAHYVALGCICAAWIAMDVIHIVRAAGLTSSMFYLSPEAALASVHVYQLTYMNLIAAMVVILVLRPDTIPRTSQAEDNTERSSAANIDGSDSSSLRTELEAAREELQQEKARQTQAFEEAKRRFLRYVCHELRTPMNSVHLGLTIMSDEPALSQASRASAAAVTFVQTEMNPLLAHPEQENANGLTDGHRLCLLPAGNLAALLSTETHMAFDATVRAADNIKEIVDDTLHWLALQDGSSHLSVSPTNLCSVVSSAVKVMHRVATQSNPKVKLQLQYLDPMLPDWVLADQARLQQLVQMYIRTGISFATRDGTGCVNVSVRLMPQREPGSSIDLRNVWWSVEGDDNLDDIAAWTQSAAGSRAVPSLACLPVRDDDVRRLTSAGFTLTPQALHHNQQYCSVIIEVESNGRSVSQEDAPLLFTAFRQLEAGSQHLGRGTGLGPAICREIVKLHGGRVAVRCRDNNGGEEEDRVVFMAALSLPVVYRANEGRHDGGDIEGGAVVETLWQCDPRGALFDPSHQQFA